MGEGFNSHTMSVLVGGGWKPDMLVALFLMSDVGYKSLKIY